MRSYTDSSGGNDNLVLFRKDAIGIRVYQQSFGSATAYSTYKDVAFTDSNITGTATNITAYTINQNVGTGNSPSFVTVTSTQATGTAPFTVSSTTAVTNLNADLLDGSHASAFYLASNPSGYTTNTGTVTSVGGTGTVSGLTLTGTVTTTGNLTLGGTLSVAASNFASQTANTFLAAPNGSAGVPTFRAIAAADIPTLNQNTTGTASNITAYTINQNLGTSNTPTFNYVIFKDVNNANTYGFRGLSGIITADGGAQYPTGWNFQYGGSSTSALYITSSGNVGINDTSPGTKLVINHQGTINTTTPGTTLYNIHFTGLSTNDNAQGITFNGGGGGAQAGLYVQGSSAYGTRMYFATTNDYGAGSKTRMMIDYTGNVGIGTTSPGAYKLYVNGPSYYTDTVNFAAGTNSVISWTTGYSDGTTLIVRGPDAGSMILQPNNSYTGIFISSTGNVGIGTTTPGYKLDVTGTANVNGAFTAVTKSFKIKHQREEGKSLIYGVLEGPEHAVYARGKLTNSNTIILPEEWEWLVDMDSVTVQLTPIGSHQKLYVKSIDNLTVTVGNENIFSSNINCYYIVHAIRKDVEPLQTVV